MANQRSNPVAVTMPILLVIVVGMLFAPSVPQEFFPVYKGGMIVVIVAAIAFVMWRALKGMSESS